MRYRNRDGHWTLIAIIAIIVVVIVLIALVINSAWNTNYTISGMVKAKWVDVYDDNSCYLLRITMEDGTDRMLEVNRNILHGSNYNPDIVYSDITVNTTYKFTCWGWDWQWAMVYWYPMVTIAEEVYE